MMKVGKFRISPMYDCQCDVCGEYRTNIGWCISIFKKPRVKDLKAEGWTYVEGIGQICPNCAPKFKKGESE